MSTHGIFQRDCISVCICLYYLIISTRKKILSVNNLNLLYFCFNRRWKLFLFSTWHVKFHQYFKSLSILSPILQESLSINLTFFRRFLLVLNSNYFQLWLYSTNVPQANESKVRVLWDRDCSESFRSASKSLIHTNTGFQPCPELLPPLPWARSLSQSHCIWGQGGSSSHQQQQQQWWALPHLLWGRSASLV